jgi:excisionase family DNA binding protein
MVMHATSITNSSQIITTRHKEVNVTSPPSPQLLDVDEVATRLRVCAKTVRRLYNTDQLQTVWVGRKVFITETAVNAFIASSGTKSLAPAVT